MSWMAATSRSTKPKSVREGLATPAHVDPDSKIATAGHHESTVAAVVDSAAEIDPLATAIVVRVPVPVPVGFATIEVEGDIATVAPPEGSAMAVVRPVTVAEKARGVLAAATTPAKVVATVTITRVPVGDDAETEVETRTAILALV